MKKLLIISVVLLAINPPTFANKWTGLGGDKYIDKASIKMDNEHCDENSHCYSAWIKVAVPEEDNSVGYYKALHQFNCSNRMVRLKRLQPYDKKGNLMADIPSYDSEWHYEIPKTDETILLNYVCSYESIKNDDNESVALSVEPVNIYEASVNSMVYVNTQNSQGSGVIIDKNGTFLTCFHVIANADYIKIRTNGGNEYNVTGFKYINPLDDIAILTIDTSETFVPIQINQKPLNIGDKVYTISSPRGRQFTFSDGILSQLSQEDLQFTAPISPGSSGGALLNQNGDLIGIITSQYRNSQNINFALPNNYYIDKISNQTVRNNFGQKWIDFIANNASEDQFKLYTEYAINDSNYELLYKYLMPLTVKSDFPPNMYALVATFALIYSTKKFDTQAVSEAILLYKKSISQNINLEASYSGLAIAYCYKEESESLSSILQVLRISYPSAYNKFMRIINSTTTNKSDLFMQEVCEFYSYILTKIQI